MSLWGDHGMEARVVEVLSSIPAVRAERRMGRPFVTAYQIAIELVRTDPDILNALGMDLGGTGTGRPNSLAQYLGRELATRYDERRLDNRIQGGFISNRFVTELRYAGPHGPVTSSSTESGYDLSIFRFIDPIGQGA